MPDYDWKQPTPLDEAIREVQQTKKKVMYYKEMLGCWEEHYKTAADELKKLLEES